VRHDYGGSYDSSPSDFAGIGRSRKPNETERPSDGDHNHEDQEDGGMKGLVAPVVAVLVALMVLSAGVWWVREAAAIPTHRRSYTMQCDGSLPIWMLEAQDYDGGGCAEVLPSHMAPPDANWTHYCMAMCDRMEPWPPPS
jgi:hypothetical protein